jgi:hypothetical protein
MTGHTRANQSAFLRAASLLVISAAMGTSACEEEPEGCESSSECRDDERCVFDRLLERGICEIATAGSTGGGSSLGPPCSEDERPSGNVSVPLLDASGQAVAIFAFQQTRLQAPAPCTPDLETSLAIHSRSAAPLSLQYQIQFVARATGAPQGDNVGYVELQPGSISEQGVVFSANVSLSYLDILIQAR